MSSKNAFWRSFEDSLFVVGIAVAVFVFWVLLSLAESRLVPSEVVLTPTGCEVLEHHGATLTAVVTSADQPRLCSLVAPFRARQPFKPGALVSIETEHGTRVVTIADSEWLSWVKQ